MPTVLLLLLLLQLISARNFNYDEGDWLILHKPGTINAIAETYDQAVGP